MNVGVGTVVAWLTDVYWLATVVLGAAAVAMAALRQPARRVVVARATLAVLAAIGPLAAAMPRPGVPECCAPAPGARERFVVGAFAVGAGANLAWLGVGAVVAARLVRTSRTASRRLTDSLDRVTGGRADAPRLVVGPVAQPLAVGLWRPAIILPGPDRGPVPDGEVEAALSHEWAHIRRGDLWGLAASRALLPLFFAHPLYHWLRHRVRVDQELLADAEAAAFGGRFAYAEALLDWAKRGAAHARFSTGPTLGLGGRSPLARRVAVLLDPDTRVERACPRAWRVGVGVAATAVVLGIGFVPRGLAARTNAAPVGFHTHAAALAYSCPAEPAPLPLPLPLPLHCCQGP